MGRAARRPSAKVEAHDARRGNRKVEPVRTALTPATISGVAAHVGNEDAGKRTDFHGLTGTSAGLGPGVLVVDDFLGLVLVVAGERLGGNRLRRPWDAAASGRLRNRHASCPR